MAIYDDPRPASAYDFAGNSPGEYQDLRDTAWIEVIRKMEEVYSDLIAYEVELEEKNAALEEAQRFITSVLSSVSDILVVCDQKGAISQVNLAFLRLTGLAECDLVGSPLEPLMVGENGPVRLHSWVDAARSDQEVRFVTSDGSPGEPVAMTCATLLDHRGLPAGLVLTGRPVGELRRAYEALKTAQAQLIQQEKMASLGRLIAGVAHELNNPISFVTGNVHALAKYIQRIAAYLEAIHDGCSPEFRETLRVQLRVDAALADLPALMEGTTEGAQRVADIVRSLKRLSFSSTGRAERIDLAEVAAKAAQWASSGAKANAQVIIDLPDPLLVRGHAGQLHQVVVNLVENAADAIAGRNGATLTVCGRCEGGDVVLRVEDSGPGMDADILDKVFDPFFTTKPVGKGTGLGLWISYGIVRDHGGLLEAANGERGGARFTVRLPRA